MSPTCVHCITSSSSVLADYSLLVCHAAAHPHRFHEKGGSSSKNILNTPERLVSRPRTAMPPSYQPIRPSMGLLSPFNASETAPLLGRNSQLSRATERSDIPDAVKPEPGAVAAYWEEAKILLKYTLPVYSTQVLDYSLIIASVISIGHLSTISLAASSLGSMTASVTGYSILQGFASTLDTVLPSAWTSDQPQLVGLWTQRMTVIMAVVLIPIASVWYNAESILLLLRQDPEVAGLAALYLRWALLGLPAYAFNQISRRYFQSQGLFSVPTKVTLVVAPINAFLNYLLVWGPKSIRLGFIGAPIASAISFNLISILSLAYGIFLVPRKAWHPLSRRMFTNLGILTKLSIAGVGQSASEWWSWELINLAASQLGPIALATQSVLLVSASCAFQAPFSLSYAASVRIGNLLGEKDARRAGIASNSSLLVVLGIEAVNSSVFLIFRNKWGYLFNNDLRVVALVASILPLVALLQVMDGLSVVTAGILRARGKQATGAVLNFLAYYVAGIPLGLWLTFSRGMNLIGLWVGLTIALVWLSAAGLWICLRTDWEREVEKVVERMDKERIEGERYRNAAAANDGDSAAGMSSA